MDGSLYAASAEELAFGRSCHCDCHCSAIHCGTGTWDKSMAIRIGLNNRANLPKVLCEETDIATEGNKVNSGECSLDIRRRCGIHVCQLTVTTV
jgi:hypothetical protein